MAFEPGEIVQLKSGSPALTVIETAGNDVTVIWYADEVPEFRTHTIPAVALEVLELIEFDEDEDDSDDEDADEDED